MSMNNDYLLAMETAKGESADFEEAARLLHKATDSGSPEAFFAIGNWYFHGRHYSKDISKAIDYWEKGSALGNIDSMLELGNLYELGENAEKDLEKAYYHYLRAALSNDGQGCFEISRFYYYGFFVPESKKISDAWRDKADLLGYKDD